MKSSIETMLNAYVYDNASYIKENGGNVAEYILRDANAMDQGWLWFLSENEIEDFENGNDAKYIAEITDYVNNNYDYIID